MKPIRCASCGRLLLKAEVYSLLEVKCPRCKTVNSFRSSEFKPTPAKAQPECPAHRA
ncbi:MULTISPECIES: Com family DNA-binding transcriptional regulator [Zymobacter]|uniref:Com family DNA-binding transcriptional regulator n=1 Tax=Zymobacter TaxID=33073 RepID=UPI000E74C686